MPHRFLLLCIAAATVLPAADPIVIEQIVAKVNGEIITRSELERMKRGMAEEMKANNANAADIAKAIQDRGKDFLREKIDTMLLVQKGRDLTINLDPDVTKYIADLQRKSKIADADKFQAYIRENTGMPYEDYRAEIKNNMLTRRVIGQEVSSKIVIPKAELRKFYDEHKNDYQREERVFLREIFLTLDGKAEAEKLAVEKKAKDLVARARKGEKFNELARDNSDSETAKSEGELPPSKKGELRKELEDKVWAAKKNEILEPIPFSNGWLILKVDEHHQAGLAEFEEVESEVMNRLFEPRMQPAVREYLTKLRSDAFLEIREGYVDTAAAAGKSTRWSDPMQLKPETVTRAEVANQKRRKRLLFVPVPRTSTGNVSTSKS